MNKLYTFNDRDVCLNPDEFIKFRIGKYMFCAEYAIDRDGCSWVRGRIKTDEISMGLPTYRGLKNECLIKSYHDMADAIASEGGYKTECDMEICIKVLEVLINSLKI